jgi:hypothetical protein
MRTDSFCDRFIYVYENILKSRGCTKYILNRFVAFGVDDLPVATTTSVKVLAIFIANLTAAFASAKLSAFDEARVPISAHHAVVEACSVDVSHARLGIFAGVVFDEAEAARSLEKWGFLMILFGGFFGFLTFLNLSRPMTMRRTSPHLEKSS